MKRGGLSPQAATVLVAVTAALSGCNSSNIGYSSGDFGRQKPWFVAPLMGEPVGSLTSVEQELRNRAVYFRISDGLNDSASAPARYNSLTDHVANDTVLLLAFAQTVMDVREKDRIRLTAAEVFPDSGGGAKRGAHARAEANEAVIHEVCSAVFTRAGSYRTELERLVVSVPEREAVAAERGLAQLEQQAALRCGAGASGRGEETKMQGNTPATAKDVKKY